MNILCTTDDNYVPYCGIMLTSLFETNKSSNINVYLILTDSVSDKNKKLFKILAQKYNQTIFLIDIDEELFKDCPIYEGDHVSQAAYYRILAPKLLPQNIDKILYLDSDIIVARDISGLWKENIEDVALACVVDPICVSEEIYNRLKYDKKYSYFNSGVMLINLDYWRKNDVMERCFYFISKHSEMIRWHDQDALNIVLHKSKKLLPLSYNFQTTYLLKDNPWGGGGFIEEVNNTIKSPSIIHFSNAKKPWIKGSEHPYVDYFLHFRKKSLWKRLPLISSPMKLKARIIKILYEIASLLHLKRKKTPYFIKKQKVKLS